MTISYLSDKRNSRKQPGVAVYCDFQNVYLSPEIATTLLYFAKLKGNLIRKKVYYNSLSSNQASVKENLVKIGFHCDDVNCSIKNSADNQLKSDLMDDVYSSNSPDIIILVSGDGDFKNTVKFSQERKKRVIVIAQQGNVKKILKELADEFYFVEELHQVVTNQLQQQNITSTDSCIQYNEAIEYLLQAIRMAISQKKDTLLNEVDQMMRQICPKYQGVSSICKLDGKKFKKFIQFIESAEKDGKVKKRDQKLLLIE